VLLSYLDSVSQRLFRLLIFAPAIVLKPACRGPSGYACTQQRSWLAGIAKK